MKYVIYRAKCIINNKIYIGYTRDLEARKQEHLYHARTLRNNYVFHKAIRKYGFENFIWDILDSSNDVSVILEKEQKYIIQHNSYYKNGVGYNMNLGGVGNVGYVYTQEARAKMSKAWTNERREKQSKIMRGKRFSEEHRANLRKAAKNRKKENYRKVRLQNQAKYETPEYRKNLSNAVKEWWRQRKLNGWNK